MKKLLLIIPALLIAGIFFFGCQEEPNLTDPNIVQKVDVGYAGSNQSCVELTAGQTMNAGEVCFDDIDTDGDGEVDALQVCYNTNTSAGWQLVEAHFFIGTSSSEIPMTKSGNPIPGQFPYKSGNITGQTSYCFTIPFSAINFECPGPTKFVVAAHAALQKVINGTVVQTETGWGKGTRITNKGNWGMYFDIYITCDDQTPPPANGCSETAFAKGDISFCFDQYQEFLDNPNRWGWTNFINTTGTYNMTLWAGAGQCDITKGTNVGILTVNYNGNSAVVTYTVNAPYSLEKVHLYVGCEELPKKCTGNPNNPNCEYTLAPGQYPIESGLLPDVTTTWTYTVNNLSCSNGIYVVAHADVKGFPCN